MPHGKVYANILETVHHTPLVKLSRVMPGQTATVLLKLEFFNPLSSVKDRIGRAMIESAEQQGLITRDTRVIEPTSGNTGIALAFICASRGYRLTLTMPASASLERQAMLRALGAELVLTPASEGMAGAIARACELCAESKLAWMPQQFENPVNPEIHQRTTAVEIWNDTAGRVDMVVSGVGTGGTITGVTRYMRCRKPGFEAVAVEPAESPVISGGRPGPHRIQGIGSGFVPKNLDTSLLSGVEAVSSEEATDWARRLTRYEGIFCGISTGANLAAAARLAARPENREKLIVTFAPSAGERYLSTPLYDNIEESA